MLALNDGAELINAANNLIQSLVKIFGAWGTIGIVAAGLAASTLWKVYNFRRKDREVNLALREKDRTIQRLAEQERNYRILFFMEKAGWTDEKIQQFVMRNEFEDVPSARRELEGEKPAEKAEEPKRGRRSRRR